MVVARRGGGRTSLWTDTAPSCGGNVVQGIDGAASASRYAGDEVAYSTACPFGVEISPS
jgi:hypothetical protein